MTCEPEPSNRFDQWACVVRAPPLESLARGVWYEETRGPPNRQIVREICGHTVGRVPARICNAISVGLAQHTVHSATCFYVGGFTHGGPVQGGGPQLKAAYLLEMDDGPSVLRSTSYLKDFLDSPYDIYF